MDKIKFVKRTKKKKNKKNKKNKKDKKYKSNIKPKEFNEGVGRQRPHNNMETLPNYT